MRTIELSAPDDFEAWRDGARQALLNGIPPGDLFFRTPKDDADLLFNGATLNSDEGDTNRSNMATNPIVTRRLIGLAKQVVCHRDPERFSLMYKLLYRLQQDRNLLSKTTDKDVHHAEAMAKEVRRDMHKMKAFVRFRKIGEHESGREIFVSWFEPTHFSLRATAPFFKRRFAGMDWSILTPDLCAHWRDAELTFTPGVTKMHAPSGDELEDYWRSYYASIFNPARLKISAMQSEMPKKYWKNLPEAELIPDLVAKAQKREKEMLEEAPSEPRAKMMAQRPEPREVEIINREEINTIAGLNGALRQCRACPLWQDATQAVPGDGPTTANLMLVGEQPGDIEDLCGRPFSGPAGKLLKSILGEANADQVYLTNAVKHFKFAPRGKRRIHKSPDGSQIEKCSWWLKKEIELVRPRAILALGSTAIRALTGKAAKVSEMRQTVYRYGEMSVLICSRHPASVLRARTENERAMARAELQTDVRFATELANQDITERELAEKGLEMMASSFG